MENKKSDIPLKKKKWTVFKKPQFVLLATLLFLCIIISANEIWDIPNLLRGIEPQPVDWIEFATEVGMVFLVSVFSIFLWSGTESRRKRAEEALRESEEKWRSLVKNAPNMIIIVNRDSTIQFINCTVSPLTIEETIGKSIYDYIETEYHNVVRETIEHVLQTGQLGRYEIRGVGPHGYSSWYETQVGPIKHDEQIVAVTLITTDITERKRAEEVLAKERHRLFSLLDILPVYVYLQAPDYGVPFVNRKFRELFGDPGSRPCYEVFHGRQEPCEDCVTLRVLDTGAPQVYEWASKAGRTYMIYEDLFPAVDGAEMVVEVGIDITERKRAEEALRESEERFRQLAENIDQVFWLTDWENNKLLYVNPSYEKLFGRSCQSAYEDRLSWYQVMHPDDRARVRESLVKNAELGQNTEIEYRIVRDDGAMRWILDRNYPIRDKHGKVYRIG